MNKKSKILKLNKNKLTKWTKLGDVDLKILGKARKGITGGHLFEIGKGYKVLVAHGHDPENLKGEVWVVEGIEDGPHLKKGVKIAVIT